MLPFQLLIVLFHKYFHQHRKRNLIFFLLFILPQFGNVSKNCFSFKEFSSTSYKKQQKKIFHLMTLLLFCSFWLFLENLIFLCMMFMEYFFEFDSIVAIIIIFLLISALWLLRGLIFLIQK